MKTFKELVVGDTIWYYDHGKMHPQKILKIEDLEEVSEYTDWRGNKVINKYPYRFIYVKRVKSPYRVHTYDLNRTEDWFNRLHRFSCIEAAATYMTKRINWCDRKISYFNKQLNKYNKLREKYDMPE